MIHQEQWEFHPEWKDYVLDKWEGKGRVEQVKDDSIQPFRDRAIQAFKEFGFEFKQVKTWINVMTPEDGEGYSKGYPHIHYPLTGLTLVHYLEPGENKTPLHILIDDEVVEKVYPEKGLTVFMPNDLWHGVLRNTGKDKRVAMIATALK